MEDDNLPRMRHDAAGQLATEVLDSYSQDELLERIQVLEAEIARVKRHHAKAADHKKFADSLFKPRDTD